MKRIILLLSMCFLIGELAARELDKAFQLLPQPQSIELTEGKGINSLPGAALFCRGNEGAGLPESLSES